MAASHYLLGQATWAGIMGRPERRRRPDRRDRNPGRVALGHTMPDQADTKVRPKQANPPAGAHNVAY
jgi:hypothetical protein